jgi:2-polyprenyl-6-methoxyphenol hydroxylase-like FAD-dependent oxidoreductase
MPEYPKLPPSGIKVIVVGGGFAGLAAAIECDRKGHAVTLLEKVDDIKEITRTGDIISFDPNGTKAFERWPGVVESMERVARTTSWIDLHHWKGKFVTRQSFAAERVWGRRINGHRGELHSIIYEHARARGIDIRLAQRVTDYFEDDEKAGVVANGQKLEADVVIAAEGVRSRGRKIVLGFDDNPKSSGYAVYRAWYPGEVVAKNPLIKHLVENGDTHVGFIGPDIHFLTSSLKGGKEFNWVFTHKDDGNVDESWQFPGKVEEAIKYLEGWSPVVQEIVKATPPTGRLIDHKLVYRDPLPTFISPKARIALIGDAAHPFLPTSIQGASQSIEDGSALAVCLELSGKGNIPLAVRAYEKLRYERVHKAQAMGPKTRDRWHKASWDSIWKNPESLHLIREAWLLNFDQEVDAYARYKGIVADLTAPKARL